MKFKRVKYQSEQIGEYAVYEYYEESEDDLMDGMITKIHSSRWMITDFGGIGAYYFYKKTLKEAKSFVVDLYDDNMEA